MSFANGWTKKLKLLQTKWLNVDSVDFEEDALLDNNYL